MDYFDCHADTLTQIPMQETLWENSGNLDLKRVSEFAPKYTQIFALWQDRALISRDVPLEKLDTCFLKMYHRAIELLEAQKEHIRLCLDARQMQEAHARKKAAAFLSLEDVSLAGSYVRKLWDMGFRFVMLSWNYENEYATGAAISQEKGLTQQGRQLAEDLLKQGMILDISHLSDRGTEDIFQLTDKPVMASHSDVRVICVHGRNLNRGQIQELIRRKGLIGMNFYRPFVGGDSVEDLLRHMDAVLEMGGTDILAIGSDFDGCSNDFPKGITGAESLPFLYDRMKEAGFGDDLVEKIFYRNAERFVVENL